MSYCRWSSDDFKCDLYIYESVHDCWTIHVAGSRYVQSIPDIPSIAEWSSGEVTTEAYRAARDRRSAFMEAHEMIPIELPFAGQTFNLADPGECADKVAELIALGYQCPDYVIPELRAEQAELDAQADTHPKGGDGEAAPAPLTDAVGSGADDAP